MAKIIISSDDDAFRLLSRALKENPALSSFELNSWPTVTLRFTGAHYSGTITAANAQAILDYQKAVDRAYLSFVKTDSTRLSNDEKDKLAIKAKVEPGSSIVEIDLTDALKHFLTQLSGKMTASEIIILILGLGVIAGATVVAKQFFKSRADRLEGQDQLQQQVNLSREETKRLEIVTRAMQSNSRLESSLTDFDDAREQVLKSAGDADNLNFDGIELERQQVAALNRIERTKSSAIQANGVYAIRGVRWVDDESVNLELISRDKSNLEFTAKLSTKSLSETDKDLLATAEWQRTDLYLSINAKSLRGSITGAQVVGFDWDRLRQANKREQ